MPSTPSAPRRVCHLIKGLGRGGAEQLLPQLIRASSPDFEFSVGYFLPQKNALVEELEGITTGVVCFHRRTPLSILVSVTTVAEWLRREGADLLHCHLPLAAVVGRLAGRWAGVPVLYTEHNLQERYHPMTRWANRATWKLQQVAIAVSQEVAVSVHRSLDSPVPVRVIRNGIDSRRLAVNAAAAAQTRKRLAIPPRAPLVGTVAVMRTQKRLDLWLLAARGVIQHHPETHFVVVGDGPLRRSLEAQADSLALRSRVHFPGLQEDVGPFLAAMDVYLVSSEFEGLPLAVLEAMAAELPVVATRAGGIPEAVEEGKSGFLVPPGDVAGLTRATLRLLSDHGLRAAMGAEGRRRVERDFSIQGMARELEGLYQDVLGLCGSRK